MKRMIVVLALAAVLSGCDGGLFRGKELSGSGKSKLEKRSLAGFKSVNVSGAYDVEIAVQKEPGLEMEGDDNLLPRVRTEVKDGVLSIYNDEPIRPTAPSACESPSRSWTPSGLRARATSSSRT